LIEANGIKYVSLKYVQSITMK